MVIRQISSNRRPLSYARPLPKEPVKKSRKKFWAATLLIALGLVSWSFLGISHASAIGAPIKSGYSGYCLDDYRDKTTPGNQVDLWNCNDSEAQNWQYNLTQIKHGDDLCLTAVSDTKIEVDSCNSDPDQVWLPDDSGIINPNSDLCLSAPNSGQDQSLELTSCNSLTSANQTWTPSFSYSDYQCTGDQSAKVACYAVKEWINWTTQPNNHMALLNNYTGGAAYEEWCADFVSYVYKEAGYPFTNGNYAGWDENIASQIQNQGFTIHQAGSYVPKAGDVAFFDYPGGHVEIVVSGGPRPTFVYGNSATIDPTTDNGQMATNAKTNDPSLGQVEYYMSPNSST